MNAWCPPLTAEQRKPSYYCAIRFRAFMILMLETTISTIPTNQPIKNAANPPRTIMDLGVRIATINKMHAMTFQMEIMPIPI
ncbi:MAG: hypothetical protein JJ974_04145 [Phycisphaerales bacterium]|nr:hypothetical protein [Phycisphaerales bacterium]